MNGFLQTTLHLECSEEKTKIVHHTKGVIFLGYQLITHSLKANAGRVKWGEQAGTKIKRRYWNGIGIHLLIPESKVRDFVKQKRYGNPNNGSD